MKVWITLKRNINTQIDNNWCYKTIMQCINMAKLKQIVQWGCILSKGQCYSEKQWILTFMFHSLGCIILGITVHNLRIEANYTSLHELIHRYCRGNIKDTNHDKIALSLQEMEDIIWAEINNINSWDIYLVSRNISRICKACLETWGHYLRLTYKIDEYELQGKNRSKIHNRSKLCM